MKSQFSKIKNIYLNVILACLRAGSRTVKCPESLTLSWLAVLRFWSAARMTMRNTFNFLLVLLTFTFYLLPFSPNVSAHILENVEDIGAVMHIQPDDDPIVGEESLLFFEFKDKENVFLPSNCDCTFIVEQSEKVIYTQSVSLSNWDEKLKSLTVAYTFPEKGEYTVRITGKPSGKETFNEFSLSYDVRITRILQQSNISPPPQESQLIKFTPLGLLAIGAAVGGLFFALARRGKK